jgi:hypothetical protein
MGKNVKIKGMEISWSLQYSFPESPIIMSFTWIYMLWAIIDLPKHFVPDEMEG